MKSIVQAIPQKDYHLQVSFDDGARFDVDLRPFIKSGVSAALRDEAYFRTVQVADGYIYWENGFDFCPEALYEYAVKNVRHIDEKAVG